MLKVNRVKAVVAMSGGVDSSVAAALLKEEGYQVIGVTMHIWPRDRQENEGNGYGCCGIGATEDAKRVAHRLSIPHYVMNFRDIFAQTVIADFYREYSRGRTPNPCIRCNQYIKFGALLEKAKQLGADIIATGHHARKEMDKTAEIFTLKKGVDQYKDQSYFLHPVAQEQLKHILFPVGNFTKDRIREMAGELRLPVADKPESQEICFIPDDNYSRFLKDYKPHAIEPGPILDKQGNILGKHEGIMFYTIGQRKGLGIPARKPLYVIDIVPERNAIIVGNKDDLYGRELIASRVNWITQARPTQPITVKAKIRYRHQEAEAEVAPGDGEKTYVKFAEPQMAITPGQAVVFYDSDTVLGGGTIEQVRR
ncbi:tRNA 2-thiouridine(34) synthase MnmA [Chloroflexota bacterium]